MYIMAKYKVPESYIVELPRAEPMLVSGPKLNRNPNFTESIHLILCLATVAFWEITRKKCDPMRTTMECNNECSASARDGALSIFIATAGFYIVDYYSGFDQKPGDPNERCLYIPRFILYACTGVLYIVRNEATYGCKGWDIAFGILSILYCILSLKHFWLSTIQGIIVASPPPINPYPKEERVKRKKFRGQGRRIAPMGEAKNKI